MRNLMKRARGLVLTASIGGSALALGGCDPTVRDTVLTGVGSAATGLTSTFIQAFIESLQNQGEEVATTI